MKKILIISIGFLPNLGGLETHLKDLVDILVLEKWRVTVLTYQPLNTPVLGKWIERTGNSTIYRLPIIRGYFYKLLKYPLLEFLFLVPLIFITTPFLLLKDGKIQTINGQGIIAGLCAVFWGKVFKKKVVLATQSVYKFPKKGLYRQFSKFIFSSSDKILAISRQSAQELYLLGIPKEKVQVFTHWENIELFKPFEKDQAKKVLNLKNKFVVSFFGRLVEEKGVKVLLRAIEKVAPGVTFLIYGEGPLQDQVKKVSQNLENVIYMGTVLPHTLPLHYSAADLVVMPSLHVEGFGRVAAGSLLCSTPVIVSNRGALPEVINDKVGEVIEPTSGELAKAIDKLFKNKQLLRDKQKNARAYAVKNFSSKNAEVIVSEFNVSPRAKL